MSQSATYYRVTKQTFIQLEKSHGNRKFNFSDAKGEAIFISTFMGLEFILSKEQSQTISALVNEIFNPKNVLGMEELESITPEEQLEFYDGGLIPYIDPETISEINTFLLSVSEDELQLRYDANELNVNGIYPNVWNNENFRDFAFNAIHLKADFKLLNEFIKQAAKDNDYILVFVG